MQTTAILAVTMALTTTVTAENWPHWRGPRRDGSSLEKNLPVTWTHERNIAWKTPMSAWSGSTPIIWGDYIFLNSAEGGQRSVGRGQRRSRTTTGTTTETAVDPLSKKLSLWCLDRNSGEILWKRSLGEGNRQLRKQNMSSPSPVTDGKHVWVVTGTGIVKGFNFQGTEIWSRDLQQEYGAFGLNWGYASSPLLYQDTIYLQVLHGMKTDDPSYVMAVDKATGRNRWRVERPTDAIHESPDSYTTPLLVDYQGSKELVISGGDYVTGHDLNSGKELWRAAGLNPNRDRNYRIVASPVFNDGMIYVPSRRNPLQAFRLGGRGDVTESHRVWQTPSGPDVPTPVSDGEYLYILGDKGVMSCLDAKTGRVVWGPERVQPGIYSASPVLADGKLYVTSEDGLVTVLAAGPEFKKLAENQLEGYTLASLAISEGQLFIRTEEYLYCVGSPR